MEKSKRRIYKDEDGTPVKAGDTIRFSYGIPPVPVTGTLFERDGKLIMPTPGHNPPEATIGSIIYHCGFFTLVRTKEESDALRAKFTADATT